MYFKEALIIVDMQNYFRTARDRSTISNVKKLIKEFIEKRRPIIVLEYYFEDKNIGHTLPCLTKILDDYYETRYVRKSDDDGAAEVMECLEQNCWKVEKFKVCGVNIGACVRSTVETLTYEYNQTVEVVKKACNGQETRSIAFKRNSDFYLNSPNVSVV
jgi:hypothetical protein